VRGRERTGPALSRGGREKKGRGDKNIRARTERRAPPFQEAERFAGKERIVGLPLLRNERNYHIVIRGEKKGEGLLIGEEERVALSAEAKEKNVLSRSKEKRGEGEEAVSYLIGEKKGSLPQKGSACGPL